MKRKPIVSRVALLMMLAVFSVVWQGCGQDDAYTAAEGSQVEINPSEVAITGAGATACNFSASTYEPVRVTVRNEAGVPLANAAITINISWAPGTSGGSVPTTVIAYDGDDPTNAIVFPYTTQTGDHGTKDLILWLDISCPWISTFGVFSGPTYESMEINIS